MSGAVDGSSLECSSRLAASNAFSKRVMLAGAPAPPWS